MQAMFELIKSSVEASIRRVQDSHSRLLNCVTVFSLLSVLRWHLLPSLENGQELELFTCSSYIFDVLHLSSSMHKQSAVYIWCICRIRNDVKGSRVSGTQRCKHLGL